MERYADDSESVNRQRDQRDAPITIALLLAQHRMSKMEEIVTRNLFRIIWVAFSVYASSTTMVIDSTGVDQETPIVFLPVKPVALFMIALVLFVTSRRTAAYLEMQSNTFRDLLVSSEPKLKDSYVRGYYREESFVSRKLAGREEFFWFYTVAAILALRLASVLFGQ